MNRRKRKLYHSHFFDKAKLLYYRQHICEFIEDYVFNKNSVANGGELFLSEQQKEILISIQNNKLVSVKSGRGIGKTAAIAFACIWWLCMYPNNCKFVCTAPSYKTLKTGLWNEICMWFNMSLVSSLFEIGSERLYLRENRNGCFAEPRTARDKEAMSGIHAVNLLIICDEASGTDDGILTTLDGTLTGKKQNKLCLITNPTRTTGFFYDTFYIDKKRWVGLTYSSEDSPFVDPDHVSSYESKYGRDHPLFLVDVFGEFPPANTDSFMSMEEVRKAMERSVEPSGEIEIGLDVARYGDDLTVLYWRWGNKVYPAKTLAKSSVPEVVELAINTVIEIRALTGSVDRINIKIDDGAMGGGVVDFLTLDRENNLNVIPCLFGGAGTDVYANEASIMWGGVKDVINKIELPNDQNLRQELASRRWGLSSRGKIEIEPKSRYKKDFGNSPDRADALVLLFARKKNARTVIKEFDPIDKEVIKSSIQYSGEDRFSSMWMTKDLNCSIIYVSWNNSILTVYDEYTGDDPLIYIASDIFRHKPLKQIIGNNNMFSRSGDNIFMKLMKYKINVHENFLYEELGAIEALNEFVVQKRLHIYNKCTKTIDQLNRWKMEGSKLSLETDFGLCYSLINIVSMMKKKLELRNRSTSFVPYTNQKLDFIRDINSSSSKMNKNAWMLK